MPKQHESAPRPPLPGEEALPKTYQPTDHEERIRARWESSGAFHADPDKVLSGERKPYAIVIPPPNVTGALHLGHALNNTLQDILVRAHRMMGFEALWMPGADHAGIATQTVVEKRLLKEEGRRRTEYTREQFVEKVQAWKDEYEERIKGQLRAMGCSCDWDRWRFTMDDICARAVREAFFRLFKDGLIYRGKRLVNWDPVTQTALADDEVEMEEVDGQFYYLRYPLVRAGTQARGQGGTKGDGGATPSPGSAGEGGRRPGEGSFSSPSPRSRSSVSHTSMPHGSASEQSDPCHPDSAPVTWGDLARRGYPGAGEHPAGEQAWVTVATTRPETYLGDTAVGVNPSDPRAAALRGCGARLPFVGRVIPIVEDSYVVMPAPDPDAPGVDPKAKYATGFLKVTPAHDENDWAIGQRHGLAVINVMAPDATISDKHGWTDAGDEVHRRGWIGMSREDARRAIVKAFKEHGLLEDQKPYRHSVGHSYRSHVPIEPYLSDQWYVSVTDERLKGSALRAVASPQRTSGTFMPRPGEKTDGVMRFFPERYAKMYESWHDNLRDWCISRQLWWGHRIPVWRIEFSTAFPIPRGMSFEESAAAHRPNHEYLVWRLLETAGIRDACVVRWSPTSAEATCFVCTADVDAAYSLDLFASYVESGRAGALQKNPQYLALLKQIEQLHGHEALNAATELHSPGGAREFAHDPDVLDTWFSSALWPLSTMGWPEPDAQPDTRGLLDAFNPTSVLSTAREIITLWVSRMVMFNRYFTEDHRAPFRDVYIHMVVQDGEGKRMSKSAGNGVDPLDIIATHGADAMRYTLCKMATQTQDVRMPVEPDPATGRNTSPKFDEGKRFCNKLWNAARFTMTMLGEAHAERAGSGAPPATNALSLVDRWMLSRLASSVKQIEAALANYEFSVYAQSIYDLLWRDFCDWYLEAVKPTLKRDVNQQAALRTTLDCILRLLHPACPFVTEAIYERLRELPKPPIGAGSPAARIELRDDDLLCRASWPLVPESLIDADAERRFERMRSLIEAIRNVREQQKIRPQRRITLHADESLAREIAGAGGLVETLAGLERVATDSPTGPASPFTFDARELRLSNLIDAADAGAAAAAERERLKKQITDLDNSIRVLEGRLNNPGYAQKAPAHLVQQSRDQLDGLKSERDAARASLERMP